MAPIVDGLEDRYGDSMRFVRLDMDDARDNQTARRLGALGHPVCILLNADGQVALRFAGEVSREKLEKAIEQVLEAGHK